MAHCRYFYQSGVSMLSRPYVVVELNAAPCEPRPLVQRHCSLWLCGSVALWLCGSVALPIWGRWSVLVQYPEKPHHKLIVGLGVAAD
jgi:hypothetical protein